MSEVLESVCCTLCSEELLVLLEQLVEGEQCTLNYGELEFGLFLALGRGEGHNLLQEESGDLIIINVYNTCSTCWNFGVVA